MAVLTLTLTDDGGLPIYIRADMVSSIGFPLIEMREQARRAGRKIEGGVLWMVGRIGHGMREDPREVVKAIQDHESGMAVHDQMALVLHDLGGSRLWFRCSHISSISGLPIKLRQDAAKSGRIVQGTTLWSVGGHGIVVREKTEEVIQKMKDVKLTRTDIIPDFALKIEGPVSSIDDHSGKKH